ncbi:phage protein GemA/Gp16 family protein [Aliikangiella sp. IMCC44359]|uniref:phage protein GemA/Gp16 family protein n=1 Tax=Aliikangiella sp. IMCC44359 TaxID=3459125 RepID=UPI00403B25D9
MLLSKSRYIQLIRISRARLNLSRFLYTNFLYILTGKKSCHDMCVDELAVVFYQMKRLSFKLVEKKAQVEHKKSYSHDNTFMNSIEQLRQIWFLMSLEGYLPDGSDKSLLEWVTAQVKYRDKSALVERLEWLPAWVVVHLLEQLKAQYLLCRKGIKNTL